LRIAGSIPHTAKAIIVLLFVCIVNISPAKAQGYDYDLAMQYYNAGEYDKASVIFQQLYDQYKYRNYLSYYIKCLSELNEFSTAEKYLKKEIKKNSGDPSLYVDLGIVYTAMNDAGKATEQYDKAVKLSLAQKPQTLNTANYFILNRLYEYAETLYLQAAAQQKSNYDYELANLYYYQRDYQKMTEKFLDLLLDYPVYLDNIQNRFQMIMASSTENDLNQLLEASLLQRIQKYPQKTVYAELLIWQYIQTGRNEEAYQQLVSIDKRTNGMGTRLIEFGQMLTQEQEFDLALKCFDYVLQSGQSNPNYNLADIEYLNTLYTKVINSPQRTQEELLTLEAKLKDNIAKTRQKQAFRMIYALASIQAFYLDKMEEASNLLSDVISQQRLSASEIAECKLLYADILLLSGNYWDAALTYAQVEKANQNNPYGHEARFRKAKLAYYTGQFQWALAQLDVLKASTSKLIANDAFELSLFITDNSALDTTYTALQMFSRADLLQYKHKDDLALLTLDSVITMFPAHEITDDILFRKAQIFESNGRYNDAIAMYQEVISKYSFDILGDNALYNMAHLYDFTLKDKVKAMDAYQKLITEYPGSIYTVDARKRFRYLRGDKLTEQ